MLCDGPVLATVDLIQVIYTDQLTAIVCEFSYCTGRQSSCVQYQDFWGKKSYLPAKNPKFRKKVLVPTRVLQKMSAKKKKATHLGVRTTHNTGDLQFFFIFSF